jgi:hypothetical protein
MTFQIKKQREMNYPEQTPFEQEAEFEQEHDFRESRGNQPTFEERATEIAEKDKSAFQQEENKVQTEEKKDEAFVEPKKKEGLWSELKIENPFEKEQDPVMRHEKRLGEVDKELGTLKQELKKEDEENGVFNYRSFKLADKINALNEEKDDIRDDLDLWKE